VIRRERGVDEYPQKIRLGIAIKVATLTASTLQTVTWIFLNYENRKLASSINLKRVVNKFSC